MNKKEIKQVANTLPSINDQIKRLKKKESREIRKINQALTKIQNEFCYFLFMFDWDETTHIQYADGTEIDTKDLTPFKDFNDKWVRWCKYWRMNRHHNTPVNDSAFHDWAIDNTKNNKDDRPCTFTHIK